MARVVSALRRQTRRGCSNTRTEQDRSIAHAGRSDSRPIRRSDNSGPITNRYRNLKGLAAPLRYQLGTRSRRLYEQRMATVGIASRLSIAARDAKGERLGSQLSRRGN